jgi:microcystin-dependent protein
MTFTPFAPGQKPSQKQVVELQNATTTAQASLTSALAAIAALQSAVAGLNAVPTGAVKAFVGDAAPTGYLLLQGQEVLTASYPALSTLCGTKYGAATAGYFKLPDLRGKAPVGLLAADADFGTLGATPGAKTVTLDSTMIPSHTHTTDSQGAHTHTLKVGISTGGSEQTLALSGNDIVSQWNTTFGAASNGAHTHTAQATGGGAAHGNIQPSIVLNYIVKT